MRPDFDTYAFRLAREASTRATCSRLSVGAIAVRRTRIVGTGYNGAPSGERHCEHERYRADPVQDPDLALVNGRLSCQRALHAEANVVDYAREEGISLAGCAFYVTTYPCFRCAEAMLFAGVSAVYVDRPEDYPHDPRVASLLRTHGVRIQMRQA